MLKGLAIVLFLFSTLVAIRILPAQNAPASTPKEGIAKTEGGGKGQKNPQTQNNNQPTPTAVASGPQPSTPTCDESCQQGRQNLQIQHRLALFTLLLVIVGALQVGSMIWQAILLKQTRQDIHTQADWMKTQSGHMSKQADLLEQQTAILGDSVEAAQQSAKAALAQVEVARLSERAWVVERIGFPDQIPRRGVPWSGGVMTAQLSIKNVGKQPAILRFSQTRFHTSERLPEKPQYQSVAPIPDGFLLAPNEENFLLCFLEEGSLEDALVNRIEGLGYPPLNLYLYGYVTYQSVGVIGTNQFCYKWRNLMGFSFEGDKAGFEKNDTTDTPSPTAKIQVRTLPGKQDSGQE